MLFEYCQLFLWYTYPAEQHTETNDQSIWSLSCDRNAIHDFWWTKRLLQGKGYNFLVRRQSLWARYRLETSLLTQPRWRRKSGKRTLSTKLTPCVHHPLPCASPFHAFSYTWAYSPTSLFLGARVPTYNEHHVFTTKDLPVWFKNYPIKNYEDVDNVQLILLLSWSYLIYWSSLQNERILFLKTSS